MNPANLGVGLHQGFVVLTSGSQTVTIPVILNVSVGPSGYVPFTCTAFAPIPMQLRAERDRLYRRWEGPERYHEDNWSAGESQEQARQNVLAVARVVESSRMVPASLERGRHVSDYRLDVP